MPNWGKERTWELMASHRISSIIYGFREKTQDDQSEWAQVIIRVWTEVEPRQKKILVPSLQVGGRTDFWETPGRRGREKHCRKKSSESGQEGGFERKNQKKGGGGQCREVALCEFQDEQGGGGYGSKKSRRKRTRLRSYSGRGGEITWFRRNLMSARYFMYRGGGGQSAPTLYSSEKHKRRAKSWSAQRETEPRKREGKRVEGEGADTSFGKRGTHPPI